MTLKKMDIFAFFLEKPPLTGNFSKFCSERIHRDTDRRVVFKFRDIWPNWPTGNRQKPWVAYLTKNSPCWLSRSRYCADRVQNLSEPAPDNVFRFWSAPDFIQIGSLSAEL